MITSVHSCSIDLFKVYSICRKQEIKNTKKRKDIYKTVVYCCILLRCEGNWADTKHGEKIQSVEVSTVYSWECVPTECKVSRPASPTPPCSLCDDHYRLELQPVLVTSHFTHRWWWGGGASEQLQQRSVLPRHSAQTGHSVEAVLASADGAGDWWVVPHHRHPCSVHHQPRWTLDPGCGHNTCWWRQYAGHMETVFLSMFGLCTLCCGHLNTNGSHISSHTKKSFPVTQNINRFV